MPEVMFAGPDGRLEGRYHHAKQAHAPVALILHPHPLHGGTMNNRVVHALYQRFQAMGFSTLRFNFRGVGASAGAYDEGRGELDDLLAVVAEQAPLDQPLLLAGFSFGAFVNAGAIARLHTQRPIAGAVLVGTAASRFAVPPVPPELHPQTLVVHGEQDDTVPLASVMDWARPQSLPVTVVPGGEHFFHGQLPLLKSLVVRHVRA